MKIAIEAIKILGGIPDDFTGKLVLHCKDGAMMLIEQLPAPKKIESGRYVSAEDAVRLLDKPIQIPLVRKSNI